MTEGEGRLSVCFLAALVVHLLAALAFRIPPARPTPPAPGAAIRVSLRAAPPEAPRRAPESAKPVAAAPPAATQVPKAPAPVVKREPTPARETRPTPRPTPEPARVVQTPPPAVAAAASRAEVSAAAAAAPAPPEAREESEGAAGWSPPSEDADPPDVPPDYAHNPRPIYPVAARRRGDEGVVTLRVEVLPSGKPGAIEIKSSSGYEALDEAAVKAVSGWTFAPARRGDRPVRAWIEAPIRFSLDRG